MCWCACAPLFSLYAVFERNCLKLKSVMSAYPSVKIRPHAKVCDISFFVNRAHVCVRIQGDGKLCFYGVKNDGVAAHAKAWSSTTSLTAVHTHILPKHGAAQQQYTTTYQNMGQHNSSTQTHTEAWDSTTEVVRVHTYTRKGKASCAPVARCRGVAGGYDVVDCTAHDSQVDCQLYCQLTY